MKNILLVLAVLLGIGVAFGVSRKDDGPKMLSVSEVSANPASFTSTIGLTGVMGAVSQEDPSVFGLMDINELKCTTGNCRKSFVPVRYQGKPPALGDELQLTGSFQTVGKGLVFVVKELKVVGHHKLKS